MDSNADASDRGTGGATNPPAPQDDLFVSLGEIRAARSTIAGIVDRTPMLSSTTAGRVTAAATGVSLADGRVFLKAEHLQRTGSFKPRGATARLAALPPAARERGVIAISAGNHAQAVAWAARAAGVHPVVVMPAGAVRSKVAACRAYGAEVILHGSTIAETWAWMEAIRDERGLTFIHPFNDREIIAGQGTVGLEVLDDLPDVDVVVVGVGGGGLACGIATAVKETRPGVRVYGVEPSGSDALTRAIDAGSVVPVTPASVADGLGAPFAGERTLAMARRYLDGIALVDDSTILGGVRFGVERLKQVLEPAGAAALAAVLAGRVPLRSGDRVCAVLSGGNVEVDRLGELVAAGTVFPDPADVVE